MRTRRSFFFLGGAMASAVGRRAAFGFPANDKVRIGCIGTGGRTRVLMRSLQSIAGTQITAVSDVWTENLDQGATLAGAGAFRTPNYQDLLARSDVDAVVIGTPEHWHVPMALDAMRAGKDVYVEKPASHDLHEGRELIAEQNRSGRILQVGMQQRSMPHFIEGAAIVRAGQLGKIIRVSMAWNRNQASRMNPKPPAVDPASVDWKRFLGRARPQPFDPFRFRNWRWFWDFGGGVNSDLMTHYLDVVHWYLGLDHVDEAYCTGGNYATRGVWETPDTAQTILTYRRAQVVVQFEATFSNRRDGNFLLFMGTEGNLYLDRGRLELRPDGPDSKLTARDIVLGDGPRGQDFYKTPDGEKLHLENWLNAVRGRIRPNAPAEAGVSSAEPGQLANLSYRMGTSVQWPGDRG